MTAADLRDIARRAAAAAPAGTTRLALADLIVDAIETAVAPVGGIAHPTGSAEAQAEYLGRLANLAKEVANSATDSDTAQRFHLRAQNLSARAAKLREGDAC